jgi:hypothetical protein
MGHVLKWQATVVLGQWVKVLGRGLDLWDPVAVVHALSAAEVGAVVSHSTTRLPHF